MSEPAWELPHGWEWVHLGALIDGFDAGRSPKAQPRPANDSEYCVLKVSAVTWGQFNPAENKAMLPGDVPKTGTTVRSGDLLISRANTANLVGAAVLVEHDYPHHMLSDKTLRIRYRQVVDGKYLLYALRTSAVREYFQLNATGTSESMRNLSQKKLAGAPIPLAAPAQQRWVVSRLDDLLGRARRAREVLADVPALLDQLRQSVLAAAFRGDLTADWRQARSDVEPAGALLERIRTERRRRFVEANPKKKYTPPTPVDAEGEGLPELPAGWVWATLEELTDSTRLVQYGILKPGPDIPDGVAYVKVKNMKGEVIDVDGLNRTTPEIHAQYSRSALGRGDLLISIRGSYGGVAIVPDELDGANITQDSARIAPLPGVDREYLRAMLRTPATQAYFREVAKGMAIRGVNIGDLRPTRIPLAPFEEQRAIVKRVNAGLAVAEKLSVHYQQLTMDLETFERAVLTKAFRGELVDPEPVESTEAHAGGSHGLPR